MTPAARAQAAIDILAALANTAQPADRFIRDWFRARRYAGSRDRAAVAERLYDVFRHRASYAWRMGSDSPRALVIASLLSESVPDEIEEVFDGSRHGPPPFDDAELRAVASPPQESPPPAVAGEFPEWLIAELTRSLSDGLIAEMRAMAARAPIDLRANSLKSTREEVLRELAALGFAAEAAPIAPHGIRLNPAAGLNALHETELFKQGAFEFQDEGSQIVAHLLAAQPGERILDYAAGAGGKALAVAADMENLGEIVAFDAHPERMKPLPDRAARAGVTIIRPVSNRGPDWARADFAAVLVDAPCSGSGTWRRNPDAKWRLTAPTLEQFKRAQAAMLDDAAGFVRPGGRLVYATCSLFCCENEDAVEGFLSRNRAFQRIKVKDVWRSLFAAELPGGSGHDFRASPFKTGTDGFFASIIERRE